MHYRDERQSAFARSIIIPIAPPRTGPKGSIPGGFLMDNGQDGGGNGTGLRKRDVTNWNIPLTNAGNTWKIKEGDV